MALDCIALVLILMVAHTLWSALEPGRLDLNLTSALNWSKLLFLIECQKPHLQNGLRIPLYDYEVKKYIYS